jgi:putative redox protein
MYANRKKLSLERVRVDVTHAKVHARDCEDCGEGREGKIDRFERRLEVTGALSDDERSRLMEIADKCPVHKTLSEGAAIVTRWRE